MINIKSQKEIEYMKEAGRITGLIHKAMKESIKPGVTTKELDKIAENVILSNGATPSFKGQPGFIDNSKFPACICVSVNEEIIHGIPSNRVLKDGDIVSVDAGACYKGYHGDSANTYPVGNISNQAKRLIKITTDSFYEGLQYAKVGYRISDISHAIQKYVEKNGFTVVKDFEGHGVGKELHEEPEIPNYGPAGHGPRLQPGMVIAVEPMVNVGTDQIEILSNNWTVVTEDRKLSAHYEHTILITDGEPELLTLV